MFTVAVALRKIKHGKLSLMGQKNVSNVHMMRLNSIPHWLDKVGVLWECIQHRQLFCIAALKSVSFLSVHFVSHRQLNQQMSVKMSKSRLRIPVSVIRTRLNPWSRTVQMLSVLNYCWEYDEPQMRVMCLLIVSCLS